MRPGKPYPATFRISCQWSHGESNPDYRHAMAVSSRWTMPPSVFVVCFKSLTISNLSFVFGFESSLRVSHPAKRCTHREAHATPSFASSLSSSTHSGAPGSRTPITWVQAKCLPVRPASRCSQEVRPGIEPGLPPYHSGVLPKHLQTDFHIATAFALVSSLSLGGFSCFK